MGLLISLFVGGLIGWLASWRRGRRNRVLGSVAMGVIGSLIGSFLAMLFSGADPASLAFSWLGLLWSGIGALVLVLLLTGSGHGPTSSDM